ncbi:hypothetical protein [Actinomadura pelletieri]|nr:hypothetical protein [Actinomadura pelletieri]
MFTETRGARITGTGTLMKRRMFTLLSATGFLMLGALPAHAGSPSPAPSKEPQVSAFASVDATDLQRKIDRHIAKYSGRQKGKNQIEWAGGKVVMTFPLPQKTDDVSAYARIHCRYGYYCVYEHALWDREGGAMINFYDYGKYNLEHYGWSRRASALENNQSGAAIGALTDEYDSTGRYLIHWSNAWYKADALADWRNDKATSVTLTS